MPDFFSYQPQAQPPAPAAPRAPLPGIGAELGDEEWAHVLRFAARRRYPAGAVVLKAGETERALCLVAAGTLDITGPGAQRSSRTEGDVLGLMGFLDGQPSAVTATVAGTGPAELVRLTPDGLQQLAAWQPRIALALLRDMGARLAVQLRQLQPGD